MEKLNEFFHKTYQAFLDEKNAPLQFTLFLLIDLIIICGVIFADKPFLNISTGLALLMVFFWLLMLKPFSVLLNPHQGADPNNQARIFYHTLKAHLIFFLFLTAAYLILSVTKPIVHVEFDVNDGTKELLTVITIVLSLMLAVITTLFKHVKEDVNSLISDAKKQTEDNIIEAKRLKDRIESLEYQITAKQLSASSELLFLYFKYMRESFIDEDLNKRLPSFEQLIDLIKIPSSQCDDFKNRLEQIKKNAHNVSREFNNLPMTRAYLLAVAAWKDTKPEIAELIKGLILSA